ncbi:MAG TPA: TetR/AcrR family transcriptional regulator [Xanthobacteraceae bacterium]|nr:TetR/AcrR family transcriptional regulator [Xanthobacteraceae bacterium]
MASGAVASAVTRFDVKRASIVGGAKDVFLRHGFEGASMDEIAAAAGVSKMTVYRYFRSKEQLFAGVIRDLCERIIDEDLERMLERRPEEALRGFARKMVAILFARDTIELHRIVIAESRRFPALGRLFYKSGPEACIAMLAAYLERHNSRRSLNLRNPRRTAEEFLELLRGYAHLRMLLGVQKTLSAREAEASIDGAVQHIFGAR